MPSNKVNDKAGYRSILKATSIFGGVQVFNILITLIRGKVVAILIGPAGMGLNALFLNGLNLVKGISSLGIAESAVKDLAGAYGDNPKAFNTTYTVFKSWIWLTALLGMGISILFAPLLSRVAFGDSSQTYAFMLLSVTFIFGALSGGIYTVLRATRKIKELAKANIYGSVSGLLVTLPILYVWGIDGVMPSIISAAATGFLVSLLFRKYVDVKEVELSLKEKFELGKPMVGMGINMSLSVLLGSLSALLLSVFITRVGGVDELGLYSAANSIMTGYVGMVFSAMSADYFPRLSQAITANNEWKKVINQQAEIVMLILTIVLSLMMGSVGFLIKLLLSDKFLEVSGFILLLGLSIPLRGLVWSLGYLYLSKGESKVFLTVELVANIVFFIFNVCGYYLYGLIGIGIANIAAFMLSAAFNKLFVLKRYGFSFSREVIKALIIGISFLIIIYAISLFEDGLWIILRWFFVLVASSYSLFMLNLRIDWLSSMKRKIGG